MKRDKTYTGSNTLGQYFWGIVTDPKLMVLCISVSQVLALASVIH